MAKWEIHSPGEWLRIVTALREENKALADKLHALESQHASEVKDLCEKSAKQLSEEEEKHKAAQVKAEAEVASTREARHGAEMDLYMHLADARRHSQDLMRRAHERELVLEEERTMWESRHRRDAEKLLQREEMVANVTAEVQRLTVALEEESTKRSEVEARNGQLNRQITELQKVVQGFEAEIEERARVSRNFATAQAQAKWLLHGKSRTAPGGGSKSGFLTSHGASVISAVPAATGLPEKPQTPRAAAEPRRASSVR
mmetsp:Transcript_52189/g.124394  ORF Transcript_52189/g.124394 Transcript_52189/m.124394 type:complete len:259 (+) Transcript_52189:45-821(+)